MDPSRREPLNIRRIQALAREAGIPTREINLMFSALEMTPPEEARGMCALAAIVGRLCAWDKIPLETAKAVLELVTKAVGSISSEAFEAWYRTRDDSNFAIARDYINYEGRFGDLPRAEVARIKSEFTAAIRERMGSATFDPFEDTLARPAPEFLTLELVNIRPPRHRLSFN